MECPVFRIAAGEDSILVVDFGQAVLKTEKLSVIAGSRLLRSLSSHIYTPMNRSGGGFEIDPARSPGRNASARLDVA